jgi:hypothetical protein
MKTRSALVLDRPRLTSRSTVWTTEQTTGHYADGAGRATEAPCGQDGPWRTSWSQAGSTVFTMTQFFSPLGRS